jgi:predicted CxxxxCH...CXXCH cytochrome family protein
MCHADPGHGVIHAAGWADLATGQFLHAAALEQDPAKLAACQGCHGADYSGGLAQVSCLSCHADPGQGLIHPDGWLNPAAKERFHGEAIRAGNWDMSGCQSCHGADYAGGIVQTSCLTCHAGTPEGCTTCHGSSEGIAPPEDTRGNRETTFYGVGAHQAHLGGSGLSAVMNCADCHHFPQGFADPAHIDGDGRAELVFGARASANGSAPVYDPQANTCAGTYCHGGGRMGSQAVPVWTEVGSGQAACGTCHGLPPAQESGHPPEVPGLACSVCHGQVVDAENSIVNSALHINGQTDF